ncbi:MAG TPA: ATP-binding protein [Kofleriaceae bacterium]|nr:ATP-binding protein [Kofleriaceae bacterium]
MPPPRRVTPLAGWSVVVVFLLIGIALLATVWSTRSSVLDASDAVGTGEALAIQQTVRASLADLEGTATSEDLAAIVREHAEEGLRYLALLDNRGGIVAAAGDPIGTGSGEVVVRNRRLQEVGGRLRIQARSLRRMRDGGRAWRIVIELEPVQAGELRETATLTLGVGALAAASLLGVAIVLVRREARRNAEERRRERERRLASLGEMSAILAHEIRNPLASLKGNAQLLAALLPAGEKPRAKAERVVDEAVRLEKLTNDLLKFVRTGELQRTPSDPGALVREAASSVTGEIEVDTGAAPAAWSLDPGRMREVLINLLDNAVAAGPPVRAAVRAERGRLVIEVADRGTGVPEEDRDRIFEPFHTGKTQGTGLGLAVVRRVIEQHGGTIAVLGNPGGGALFRAEIPEG